VEGGLWVAVARPAAPLPVVAGAVQCIEPGLWMPSPQISQASVKSLIYISVSKLRTMAGVPFSFTFLSCDDVLF
jgi:hypothetical protein